MTRRSVLRNLLAAVLPCTAAVLFTGCTTAYYGTMEKFGVHKRDIMADRVKDGRESQQDAKKQFANALEQFKSVVKAPGGSLEDKYNKLNAEYERCKTRAQEVSDRIDSIERVSKDLFAEWRQEIKQYANADLARRSQEQYDRSQALYAPMIAAMRRAESTMKPVLTAFHDQVLFLKHNLNAQSIASLKGELAGLETNIAALIRDMEASIREADGFLAGFGANSK
jgi:polyhydroxyalkanoate synthesis regulator phasin